MKNNRKKQIWKDFDKIIKELRYNFSDLTDVEIEKLINEALQNVRN